MSENNPICEKIFTVTGEYPELTYVDRDAHLTRQITDAISQHRVVIVRGLSKCGKTLLVHHTLRYVGLPQIWLSGSRLTGLKGFWKAIISNLQRHGIQYKSTLPEDIVSVLVSNQYCLIVDDFHYIGSRELRETLSRILKGLSEAGVSILVVGVQSPPMRAIEEMPDLIARSLIVTLDPWSDDDLSRIGQKGFTSCGFGIANIASLSQESFGSPFLMQKLCQIYCRRRVAKRTDSKVGYIERVERGEIDAILREAADSISYMSTYEILTSPTSCATMQTYRRHDEWKFGNLNQMILYAMTGRFPVGSLPLFEVHVMKLWQRLRQTVLLETEEIELEIIIKSLELMSENYVASYNESIIKNDAPRFDPAIERVGQVFYIRDPFLLFYLRHSSEVEAQFATLGE
jgi:hypothetical protein